MSDRQDVVKISRACARWLIDYGRQLVNDGYGTDYDPFNPVADLEPEGTGFIDDIPMENGEMWRYMNALINFARTVAGVLARQMNEPISPLTVSDLFLEDEKEL